MSLFIRQNCNFYSHRKTAKLRGILGDDALWLPPRWWTYAAENQPDGIFKDYTAPELANLLSYQKDPFKMVQALVESGFADSEPLRIHDWEDYNGYHQAYAARAKKAAGARWQKERTKEKETERRGEEKSQALLVASDGQNSHPMLENSPQLSAHEKVMLDKSLARVNAELESLKGADLPKAVERKKLLKAEQEKLLGKLGLKV